MSNLSESAPKRITDSQRQRILRLYKKLEWDTRTVNGFHKLADVSAESFAGQLVDVYLDSLDVAKASVLIDRLERLAC